MAPGGGEQERGAAVRVAGLDVGARAEGDRDGVRVSGLGRPEQRRVGVGGSRGPDHALQDALQPGEPAFAGHLQRGQPGRGRAVIQLDPARGQHPDGRRVLGGFGAEQDRLVDGLVADAVDVVAVGARAQQLADDQEVTALGGPDQAGAVPTVLVIDLRPVGQRELEQLEVALAGGDADFGLEVFCRSLGLGDRGNVEW